MKEQPAPYCWLAILGLGVATSGVLEWRGKRSLSGEASQHPLVVLYFLAHFLHALPAWLDPLSALGALVRKASNG